MRCVSVRVLASSVALAAVLAGQRPAAAVVFSDYLVQAPKLAAPERGSVAGALSHLAFDPGSLSRGDFALAIPISLPGERGAPLVSVLPSYSPDSGQSEWGIGWRVDLSIQRSAIIGDIEMAGDEFVSPWGRLVKGTDGRYYIAGQPSRISARRVNDGWEAVTGDGTTYVFASADKVAGGYAWMLSGVTSVLGETTKLSYARNPSGRAFVTAVEWGGRGDQRQYRIELSYEALAIALDDYRSGSLLSLDRRVHQVQVETRSAASGAFEVGWTYQLDYSQGPRSPAFYLTGVTKTYRSGERDPTQRYDYDFGTGTIATATLVGVPALDPVLVAKRADALQPDKAMAFDLDDDGDVDFEIAKDQTLVRQHNGAFSMEALPANPASLALCRPPTATATLPRVLARMTADATEPQVFRTTVNTVTGKTRVLVCNREGVPLSDQQIDGAWTLGPNTHLVDLNHDHRPDLIRLFSRGYQVVENASDENSYTLVTHDVGTLNDAFTPDSSWVQDMNGDGQADLVTRFSSGVGVWYGLGHFQFSPIVRTFVLKSAAGVTVTNLSQYQLTFLDVNRDGLTDVLTTQGHVLNLFINDGHQLNEVVVPGFAAITSEFGAPVVADVTGNGNFAILLVQGAGAKAIQLTTAATGLLVGAHDGKGSDATFTYKRSDATAGIGQRAVVLDSFTLASSGYDTVTYQYNYGDPVLHTLGKHLVGFGRVDKRSPQLTQHVEFLNDDDVAGVHSLSEDTDDRTPGAVRFTNSLYVDTTSNGVRWMRPSLIETGFRSPDGFARLSTTTAYTAYEREFCPTVTVTTGPSGQLVSATSLASVAAIPDDLHCLAASQSLSGTHADASLDFNYMVDLARNELGQIEHVTQLGPSVDLLVLQDITYDVNHRMYSVGAPGRGTTVASYDSLGRLSQLTDPLGLVTSVDSRDAVSDAALALRTARPDAPSTAFFHYDGKERLQSSWDDFSGASQSQPGMSYIYQDPTSTSPGRIDAQTLADAATGISRHAADLVAADGEPMAGAVWLGDHFSLGMATVTSRNALTKRSSFIGTMSSTDLAALTSADLRTRGALLAETTYAGFGHAIQVTATQQAGVVGTTTTELVLGTTELVTRVTQPGGFVAESAVDAAGKLVRKTDENGVTHRYTYDVLGRLVHLDTPDGGHTVTFDGFGRPKRITRDGIGAVSYAYDPTSGLLVHKQRFDAAGAVIDTSDTRYDSIGRPFQVAQSTSNAESDLHFGYDGQLGDSSIAGQLGRLTSARGDGWERTSLFDPLGRAYEQHVTLTGWRDLTSEKIFRSDGAVASETLTITDPGGTVKFNSTQETVLDGIGRIGALKVDGAVLYTVSYDFEGRLARADFTSGEAIIFDHDSVTHAGNGHQLEAPDSSGAVHWERESRGLVKAETYVNGSATTRRDYTYDGRGALTSATAPTDVASYTYTASGLPDSINDTAGTRSVHRTSQTLAVGDVAYTWDAAGRVIGKDDWTFDYGPNGQLAHATHPGRQIDFIYDDSNSRLLKRVDGVPVRADVAGGVLTEDHFIELVSIGGVVAGVLDNGRFTALLTDPRGTPFAGPDGTPGLASPYGARVSHLGLAEVIDYARLGWDPDLDVVRMGVRDYDAKLSQFLTPDPLYFEDLEKCQGSPLQCSLYGYAGGNPISFVDPTGLGFWANFAADVVETAATAAGGAFGFLSGGPVGMVIGAGLAKGFVRAPVDRFIRGIDPTVGRQFGAIGEGSMEAALGGILGAVLRPVAKFVFGSRATPSLESIDSLNARELTRDELTLVRGGVTPRGVASQLPDKLFKWGQCKQAAQALAEGFRAQGISGEVLEITSQKSHNGYMVSDLYEGARTAITTNGEHMAVRVGDMVFDNLNRNGVPFKAFVDSLHVAGGNVADGAISIIQRPF